MVKYSLNSCRNDMLKVVLLVECVIVPGSTLVLGPLLSVKRVLVSIDCRLLLYLYKVGTSLLVGSIFAVFLNSLFR